MPVPRRLTHGYACDWLHVFRYVGRGGRTDVTEGVQMLSKNGAVEACVGALRANAGNDAIAQLATRLLECMASTKRCVARARRCAPLPRA